MNENKYPPVVKLEAWIKQAPPEVLEALCALAGVEPRILRLIAKGQRNLSLPMGERIAEASEKVMERYPDAPAALSVFDLGETLPTYLQTGKYPPVVKLDAWLKRASSKVRTLLCVFADTHPGMCRNWTTGRRNMSARMAGRVADATVKIAKDWPDSPDPLSRGDLCEACKECPHFKKAPNATNKI